MIENHNIDIDSNPAGGNTHGTGFAIAWQDGPLNIDGVLKEPNGAFVEDIIQAAIGRLEFYQCGKFACDYNRRAINKLNKALNILDSRTEDRIKRNVEGTHNV